jgi:hypothetical protein
MSFGPQAKAAVPHEHVRYRCSFLRGNVKYYATPATPSDGYGTIRYS